MSEHQTKDSKNESISVSSNDTAVVSKTSAQKMRGWTDDDVATLRKLRDDGLTLKSIADRMGKSKFRVARAVIVYGLPKKIIFTNQVDRKTNDGSIRVRAVFKRWSSEEEEKLRRLKSERFSHQEIAKAMNRSLSSVRNKLALIGLYKNGFVKWSKEETERLASLIDAGQSIYDIASGLNRDIFSIYRHASYIGKPLSLEPAGNIETVRLDDMIEIRLKWAKKRATTKRMECDLTHDYLKELYRKQKGRCYYTGIQMDMVGGDFKCSVDRIDSNEGYVKGNVVFCCGAVNAMKLDMNVADFINVCKMVAEQNSAGLEEGDLQFVGRSRRRNKATKAREETQCA